MKLEPIKQTKIIIVVFFSFLLFIILGSLYLNLQEAKNNYTLMAKESARALFLEIVSTRKWSTMHDGVYLVVNDKIRPNPYLKDPLRDITTTNGMKLTKVNPAFMTRLISDVLKKEKSIEFHITSTKPLNPANAPDEWEKEALISFRGEKKETFKIIEDSKGSHFKYIAPLITERPCLKCHLSQGYKYGDIRGGISVKLPFTFYQNSISETNTRLYIMHILLLIVGILLIFSFGYMLIVSINRLKNAHSRIKILNGLLPICSNCKKIRNDQGYWGQVESYIEVHSEAQFSHGICPDCAEKLYGDQEWFDKKKLEEKD